MRRIITLSVSAAAILVFLSSCGSNGDTAESSSTPENETFDITGNVLVSAISNGRPGSPCFPDRASAEWPARPGSEKSGVKVNADVVVTDASGEVVALGEVRRGAYNDAPEGFDNISSYCTMLFEVDDVPEGEQFYGVKVASLPEDQYRRSKLDQDILLTPPSYK